MTYLLDPIELMDARIEEHINNFINEHTCMSCKKKVDYELYCMSPTGDGACVCAECAGLAK